MQKTTTALVLRSINYGEKDKILYLYSPEDGVISARLRGVRQQASKMKIFSLPFCLAEWELVRSSGNKEFYTVKGATLVDAFFDISTDIDKYCIGCIMLDVLKSCTYYADDINKLIFVTLLKALKSINYSVINPKIVLCKYLLEVLRIGGYALQVDKCQKCGIKISDRAFLNMDEGNVICSTCRDGNCIELAQGEIACIKNISILDFDALSNIKVDSAILDRVLVVLKKDIESRLQIQINFAQII